MSKKSSIYSDAWPNASVGRLPDEGSRSYSPLKVADKTRSADSTGEPSFILINDSLMGLRERTLPDGLTPIQAPVGQFNATSSPAAFIFHPGHNCYISKNSELNQTSKAIGAEDLALMGVLAQLPLGHWQVFALHDVQGYEHIEIAALWGVSIGNS